LIVKITDRQNNIAYSVPVGIGETLNIGDEVTVTVLSVKGNQVRIGINAPKEIAVHREEIYNRIARENERAPQDLVAAIS